jgi:hypothetical protein
MEKVNRSIPPAIAKSATVIPRILNINLPANTKITPMTAAVNTESNTIFCLPLCPYPPVSYRNMGIIPIGSIATKIGIKLSSTGSIISLALSIGSIL